jgi:hypothetical protein
MNLFFSPIIIILLSAVSVFSQAKMTDRDVEGLKGKVQKVVTEISDYEFKNGKYVENQRLVSEEMEFDESGSLLTSNSYLDGKLSTERKYGFLDNERIVIEKYHSTINTIPTDSSGKGEQTVADDRYSYKFKYKYDQKGRRIEEEWWNNTGKLEIRDIRKYDNAGNKIESNRYLEEGKLNMKSVYEYDQKGNVIKTTYPDVLGSDTVHTFEYVFDSQGNWIKQTVKELVQTDRKSQFVPSQVAYRKITYFNQKR